MKRKPKIQYYWSGSLTDPVVNWRLVGGNGEVMCQSTQGFQDKTHARFSVNAVALRLGSWGLDDPDVQKHLREVGPGRNPGVVWHEGKGK